MKTLTQLKAKAAETQFVEPRGILQAVHHGPPPSAVILLGAAGVQIKTNTPSGPVSIAIPIAELLELAAAHETEFARFVQKRSTAALLKTK